MNEDAKKRLKRKLEQFRKNPEAEIFSQERRVWETAVMELKQAIIQIEDGLIYKKACLVMAEEKLNEVMNAEEAIKHHEESSNP